MSLRQFADKGVNKSSTWGIRAAEEKMHCSVRESAVLSAELSCVSNRDPLLEKMG